MYTMYYKCLCVCIHRKKEYFSERLSALFPTVFLNTHLILSIPVLHEEYYWSYISFIIDTNFYELSYVLCQISVILITFLLIKIKSINLAIFTRNIFLFLRLCYCFYVFLLYRKCNICITTLNLSWWFLCYFYALKVLLQLAINKFSLVFYSSVISVFMFS